MNWKTLSLSIIVAWCLVQNFAEAAPGTPTLKSPANGVFVNGRVPFEWYIVADVAGYEIQVAEDENFTDKNTTEHKWYGPGGGTKLYWRARSFGGGYSAWSAFRWFISESPTIGLVSPENGVTSHDEDITFKWLNIAPNEYDFQLAWDSAFSDIAAEWMQLKDPERLVRYLPLDGSKLYWRVRASSEDYTWSEPRWFISGSVPIITLELPENGATVSGVSANFTWKEIGFYYDLQIATDEQFTNLVEDETRLGAAAHTYYDLPQDGSKLYWRVRASSETYPWSETRWFTSTQGAGYALTIEVTPKGSGEVQVSPEATNGRYAYDTVVTLTAIANRGYEFTRWDAENNSEYSTSSVVNVAMTTDKKFVAVFTTTGETSGGCSGNKSDNSSGEDDNIGKAVEYLGGCSSCIGKDIKHFMTDYLLVGIALMALALMHRFNK